MRMLIDVDGEGTVEFALKSYRQVADRPIRSVVEFESLAAWDEFCARVDRERLLTRNMRFEP